MGMIRLPSDLSDFLRLLNSKNAEYLLIGGYAVAYHGYPRATADMHIWIAADRVNAEKVVSAIREFRFKDAELTVETFTELKKIVRMGIPPIRIEVLSQIDGVEFKRCFENRIIVDISDTPVNVISLKDLKKNKKASGRLKDLADLENLS